MNEDILRGKWKQLRGQLRAWWGKLTDNDVEEIGGRWENLVGLLQERYGYTREYAEEEVKRRLREFETQYSSMMPR